MGSLSPSQSAFAALQCAETERKKVMAAQEGIIAVSPEDRGNDGHGAEGRVSTQLQHASEQGRRNFLDFVSGK